MGSTCPFCQETIAEGQTIVKCEACGSLHHDLCWEHNHGCSSYHCDQKVRQEGTTRPELVVTAGDLDRVVVPPKPARKGAAEAARMFLSQPPRRLSWLAIISLVLAGLSLLGLAAMAYGLVVGVVLAVVTGLAAMIVGVVALVVINTGRKVRGMAYAATAVLLAAVLVVVYFLSLQVFLRTHYHDSRVNLQMDESRPSEESLTRLVPARARALRANVVITCASSGAFSGEQRLGSGAVVRMENHRAWILTNRHVIGADQAADPAAVRGSIRVLFYNGETSEAKVVWLAPADVDLAIVACPALTPEKIEAVSLVAQPVEQGQNVFAVGNPEGLSWSYTEGVISSVRTRQQEGRQIEVYQTQTPINSGNSGGGLYAMNGHLVGINTWTHDKSVAEGLSFAISSRSVLELLGEDGRKRFLGGATAGPGPQTGEPPAAEAKD
jgi:S1-C subfamily serine protease